MASQPIWQTPAGSLGTIPEGVYYNTQLFATPQLIGEQVYYEVIAGALPGGFQCTTNGQLSGVPSPVTRDTISKFAIRAFTKDGMGAISRYSDRTFTFNIADINSPYFITPPGLIANIYDGTLVSDLKIEFANINNSVATARVVGGALPYNLKLAPDGTISGFVYPLTTNQFYNEYDFIVEITDGKASALRTFVIAVYDTSRLTADNTFITADNTFITADAGSSRNPVLLNREGSIGNYRNNTFFAYLFTGFNPILNSEGIYSQLQYQARNLPFQSTLPNEPDKITLDAGTGWLYGYLPFLGTTSFTFDFEVKAYQANNQFVSSKWYKYSITVEGPISTTITWLSDSNLGFMPNGGTSTFAVRAFSSQGFPLFYRLADGFYNSLPQGLTLLSNGDIAGRTSFNVFMFDNSTTTFDRLGSGNSLSNTETTFDAKHTFVVNAYSPDPDPNKPDLISVFKEFSITVLAIYDQPYENLYIQCMPPRENRLIISSLLNNTSIFDPDLIYRPLDPYFGVAKNVIYQHAFGLTASTRQDYLDAMQINHYWKKLLLGDIKTAIARDPLGNIIYEVVYCQVVDDLLNSQGQSVSKEVVLPYPLFLTVTLNIVNAVGNGTTITVSFVQEPRVPYAVGQSVTLTDVIPSTYNGTYQVVGCTTTTVTVTGTTVDPYVEGGLVSGGNPEPTATVFPNSLINMRDQIIDTIGERSDLLPLWMLSRQLDESVLGFTPAWVIAYCKPGAAGRIAYNIAEQFENKLDLINFGVDRYELDSQLSKNWDVDTQSWVPSPPQVTTFDVENHYQLNPYLPINGGDQYEVGDVLKILGSNLGGQDGVSLNITNITSTGIVVTVEFAAQPSPPFISGNYVTLENVTPASYDGFYQVFECTTTTVSFFNSNEDTYVSGGEASSENNDCFLFVNTVFAQMQITSIVGDGTTVTVGFSTQTLPPFVVGEVVTLFGVDPSSYNGQYVVLTSTTNEITFSSSLTDPYVSGGTILGSTPNNTIRGAIAYDPASFDIVQWKNQNNQVVNWVNNLFPSNIVGWQSNQGVVPIVGVFVIRGIAPQAAVFQNFDNVPSVNTTGFGTGAIFSITGVPGVPTTFDLNSLQFIVPVDSYEEVTNKYDKYLVFPYRTILG
jgi:hypothetical protein